MRIRLISAHATRVTIQASLPPRSWRPLSVRMLPACYAATNLPDRHLLVAGTQRSGHERALASAQKSHRGGRGRVRIDGGQLFFLWTKPRCHRASFIVREFVQRRVPLAGRPGRTDGEEEKPWKTTWPRIAAAPVDPMRAEHLACSQRQRHSPSRRASPPPTSASSETSCS